MINTVTYTTLEEAIDVTKDTITIEETCPRFEEIHVVVFDLVNNTLVLTVLGKT